MISIEELISRGEKLMQNAYYDGFDTFVEYNDFDEWSRLSLMYLQQQYPDHPQTKTFERLIGVGHSTSICNNFMSILKAFHNIKPHFNSPDYEGILKNIFERFHIVVRQMKRRHDGRPTIDIKDEYDVQDLLHALLRLHFGDVRPEEWTPSYAGSANRIDFLLKGNEIAIEVKMTRDVLKDKEIGDQLIIDIAKYQGHPDCKCLYCFVYDPEGIIRNPRGLESDLERFGGDFPVKVFVRPI